MKGGNHRTANMRNMEPSMESGKNPTETKAIKGLASKDSLHDKNKMVDYRPGASPKGNLGGHNTAS